MSRPLKIAIIAGEESGDILGADLMAALRKQYDGNIEIIGVGGKHLQGEGLTTLFDHAEIALMGITAILTKIPRLLSLIKQTAQMVLAQKPDCLVIIDSPEFCHRVARQVRAGNPAIPIVNYICPSVWAWRPSRAAKMKPHIDHVLAILPFEPEVLKKLGGPDATYVGHRLATDATFTTAWEQQQQREISRKPDGEKTLLVLPGSRRSEVKRMAAPFGETLKLLKERGNNIKVIVPTTPHIEALVRELSSAWAIKPEIVTNSDAKAAAFASADAALAASGTVTLELAMAGVPTVAAYKLDSIAKIIARHMLITWSASLPNIIADAPVVPEHYNEYVRADTLARQVERVLLPSAARTAQLDGFVKIRANMATPVPPSEKAAEIVLRFATKQ
jgi:lipid-A-disaccharide synthase